MVTKQPLAGRAAHEEYHLQVEYISNKAFACADALHEVCVKLSASFWTVSLSNEGPFEFAGV